MKHFYSMGKLALMLLLALQFVSCKKEDKGDDVIASFAYKVDAENYKIVVFTNYSNGINGTPSVSWDFGDNSGVSTEFSPVHTFTSEGLYTVKLTATTADGTTDTYSVDILISDPDIEMAKLVGSTEKTWKLIRDVSTGRYPLEVGPASHAAIWWAMGLNNDELAGRPCVLNDEWVFKRGGTVVYDDKGDYWAEGGVFNPSNVCTSSDHMVGLLGQDLSAWSSGTHRFELTSGTEPKLTLIGEGAFLGLCKVATDAEVTVPQSSVTYNIIKLTDGAVDTLIVQTSYTTGGSEPQPAYWRFVLVHYDNPADEPPIPGPAPELAYTFELNGLTLTTTNTTFNATSYLWDFGDGQTSTDPAPVHTYADGGAYIITLTATNENGSVSASKLAFASVDVLTDAILQGDPWRVRADNFSIFCGPALGSTGWYVVPKANLDGSMSGSDDWSCLPDDEFTFGPGNTFTYNTNGSARNDGYFGSPNGCISDEQIANSGNGAAFGSATHTYTFTPANGTQRARINLLNGATGAAFIGFYKGYYGGENTDKNVPANGGNSSNRYEVMGYANDGNTEYLFLSVDYSVLHNGSQGWSVILVR
ncbi:MAG: PKD domain-containing protein [Bacteroidales bacterium]|nr:PKD domain-containing protein [Bacteroidales bacterium]